uniref:disco-interacting protein 2 homolog C-like n=1 Tax=Macaca mulatta TaxID=9544 RepID=UPI0010A21004|nr:disco-interacting protein 2 homolog C-like [Macaca mulatta]
MACLPLHIQVKNCRCRPTDDSNQPPCWGVLSMHGLTYGVIRLDSEEKLSVLTMQDVSLVMPGGRRFVRAGATVMLVNHGILSDYPCAYKVFAE